MENLNININITDELNDIVEHYKVYEVQSNGPYSGEALIGAKNIDDANEIIKDWKEIDKDNACDSWGWSYVDEDNLVDGLISVKHGIIVNHIRYSG